MWYRLNAAVNRVYVALSQPGGDFEFLEPQVRAGDGNQYAAYLADIDDDGRDDLIWNGSPVDNRTILSPASGDGVFNIHAGAYDHPDGGLFGTGFVGYVTRIGDFDGDGRADLSWSRVVTDRNRTYVGYSRDDNGVPTLHTPEAANYDGIDTVADWSAYQTLVGRVDSDSRTDFIWNAVHAGENTIRVGLSVGQDGAWHYPAAQDHPAAVEDWHNYVPLLADIDGDGTSDLVWNQTRGSNNVSFFGFPNGDGSYNLEHGPAMHPRENLAWDSATRVVADIDNDGHDDLVWTFPGAVTRVFVARGTSL